MMGLMCLTARSAKPLLRGYRGELVMWVISQLATKSWKGFPVNYVPLSVRILSGRPNRPQWYLMTFATAALVAGSTSVMTG